MAVTTIKVQNIDVVEKHLPKRSKTQVDHTILKGQIEINNCPRCKFHSTTNMTSKYDETFTLKIINHFSKRNSYYVDVEFVDGVNKGKIMKNIRFSNFVNGKFKNELAEVLNETENETIHKKEQHTKEKESLFEKLKIAEFFRAKAERERDEEKEKRIEESRQHAEQIDLQFQRTRAEYDKRTKVEKEKIEVEKERNDLYELTITLNADLQQVKFERDKALEFMSDENLETIVMFAQMGMNLDEIKQMMKKYF